MKGVICILLFNVIILTCPSQTFHWAHSIGGKSNDGTSMVLTDQVGNLYELGHFRDTVDFDPGPGISIKVSQSLIGADVYISKSDSLGNHDWIKQIGGSGGIAATSMVIDDAKSLYVLGYFIAPIDFDPGPAIASLTYFGNGYNLFLIKLDSLGNYVWGKSIGGIGSSVLTTEITLGLSGTIYFTGNFCTFGFPPLDFNPGLGSSVLSSGFYSNPFICKWDTGGNFIWVKGFVTPQNGGAAGGGQSVKEDSLGNVYVLGHFETTMSQNIDFDPGPAVYTLTSAGMEDIFITKLDVNGSFLWAKTIGGPGRDIPSSIQIDKNGNIITSGSFQNACDFDPGPNTVSLISNGNYDIFISKYDNQGSYNWCNSFGGIGTDIGLALSLDNKNNIYSLGAFSSTIDLDPGPSTYTFNCIGSANTYILKLDSMGFFNWGRFVVGLNDNSSIYGSYINIDKYNNILVSGQYIDSMDVNPDYQQQAFTPIGGQEGFILKLGRCAIDLQTSANSIICINECVILDVYGATNYTWLPGFSTTQSIIACPLLPTTYTIFGALSESCKSQDSILVDVQECTAASEYIPNNGSAFLFPNPSQNYFSIALKTEFSGTIEVTDILGKSIFSYHVKAIKETEISLDECKAGIYVLHLLSEDGKTVYRGKLLKENN